MGKKANRKKKSGTGRTPTSTATALLAGRFTRTADKYANAHVLTFRRKDVHMLAKVTGISTNPLTGRTTFSMIPYQDSIHPYPVRFRPPLIEHASDEGKGFRLHWEKLSFVFNLPNPKSFPALPIDEADRIILRRFVSMCRELAAYSCINDGASLHLKKDSKGEWDIRADFPTQEAFRGTSVAFRQLHSGREDASFDKVKGRLNKAISRLDDPQRHEARTVIRQWEEARGKLMNSLLATLVCRKGAPGDKQPPPEFPVSFANVEPEKLLMTFQYGDTIHFSNNRQALVDLLNDEMNAAYYKYAVLQAIVGLSHLYFGLALLIEAALNE